VFNNCEGKIVLPFAANLSDDGQQLLLMTADGHTLPPKRCEMEEGAHPAKTMPSLGAAWHCLGTEVAVLGGESAHSSGTYLTREILRGK
jgi:hypothetical protein